MNSLYLLLIIIIVIFVIYFLMRKPCQKEGYRDPIYMNRQKMIYDWYPRTNGSIYGWPMDYGGSWNMFSGFVYYDKAY